MTAQTPAEIVNMATRDADMVSDLIANGKRVPRGMTEDLRNHVRKLVAVIATLEAKP